MDLLLLAQELPAPVGDEPLRIFGMTIAELSALVVFLSALAETVRSKWAKARDGKKVVAVIEAIEEAAEANPEVVGRLKASVKKKATSYGVEVGKWGLDSGLHSTVARTTLRLKKTNGVTRSTTPPPTEPEDPYVQPATDPDAPTPDPEAKDS